MTVIEYTEFKDNMKWDLCGWMEHELKKVLGSVHVNEDSSLGEIEDYCEELGSTMYVDSNLHSLIGYFTGNGYEPKDIVEMTECVYGNYIDLGYLVSEGSYYMIAGVR